MQRRKRLILEYNASECFDKNYDGTYTIIEKAIFYSAFIIRKLIDCNSKLSDEANSYSLTVFSIAPLKRIDRMHRWPEEDSHDWNNEKKTTLLGKSLCNSLIHSFVFFIRFNNASVIDSFCVSSDYDKNTVLYRFPLTEWIKYIGFIASDDIVRLDSHYSRKHAEYIYTRKERVRK